MPNANFLFRKLNSKLTLIKKTQLTVTGEYSILVATCPDQSIGLTLLSLYESHTVYD